MKTQRQRRNLRVLGGALAVLATMVVIALAHPVGGECVGLLGFLGFLGFLRPARRTKR